MSDFFLIGVGDKYAGFIVYDGDLIARRHGKGTDGMFQALTFQCLIHGAGIVYRQKETIRFAAFSRHKNGRADLLLFCVRILGGPHHSVWISQEHGLVFLT